MLAVVYCLIVENHHFYYQCKVGFQMYYDLLSLFWRHRIVVPLSFRRAVANSSLLSVQRNVRMPTGCYHQCPYLPLAGAPAQRKQPAHPASQGFMDCCRSQLTISGDRLKTHKRATISILQASLKIIKNTPVV